MIKKISCLLCIIITLIISTAHAQKCDINLNYGLVIDEDHIRFIEQGKTYVQINGESQLFIKGKEIHANNKKQRFIRDYALAIREQIPYAITDVIKAVDTNLKALSKIVAGVSGENSASHQKLQQNFDKLQWRLHRKLNQRESNYFLAPQNINDIFTGEFEREIKNILSASLENIMIITDDKISDKEADKNKQAPQYFEDKMKSISEDFELTVSNKITSIESKTTMLCEQLQKINTIEKSLTTELKALSQFNWLSNY